MSDVLPAFTCASAIGNLWSVCLGVNTFSCIAKSKGHLFPCIAFIGNIWLLKILRVNSWPS